jgi:glycosyltransferase involved in cell wall biosynthesis
MNLTIGIPTYKRNNQVKNLIDSLVEDCISRNIKIVVRDNDPASNLSLHPRVKYYRNEVNLGPMGNISRIISSCTTKWLIILGDDDIISDRFHEKLDQIATRLENDVVAIKTRGGMLQEDGDVTFYNSDMFWRYLAEDSTGGRFSGFMWISSWVINVELCRDELKSLYLHAGFNMPQMIIPLLALRNGEGTKILYSNVSLFRQKDSNDLSDTWNDGVVYGQMIGSLYTATFLSQKQIRVFLRALIGTKPLKVLAFIYRHHLYSKKVNRKSIVLYYVATYHSFTARLFCVTRFFWIPLVPNKYRKKYSVALERTFDLERL